MSDSKKSFLPFTKTKPPPPAVVTRARQTSQLGNSSTGSVDGTESTVKSKAPKRPKSWHPQQEIVLKQWAEIATSFRWMHHQTHLYYAFLSFWLTLPVIVLSSITGTMNFAQSSFPSSLNEYVPLIIGTLNLIAGVITTISSYLRVSELAEGHRVASVMFGKLSRNIRVELLLPLTERTMDGDDFIAMCRSEMDRLTEQTPDIPRKIERRFTDTFADLLQTDFYPPELLELHPVEVYRNDAEIKDSRTANVLADAALHFKQASERVKAAHVEVQPEPVMGNDPPGSIPPAPAEAVSLELQQLNTMQTVSNMLRKKHAAARASLAAPEPAHIHADAPPADSPPTDAFFDTDTSALNVV